MPDITYETPIIDRKSRLTIFGAAAYLVFAATITYFAALRSEWLSGAQLAPVN